MGKEGTNRQPTSTSASTKKYSMANQSSRCNRPLQKDTGLENSTLFANNHAHSWVWWRNLWWNINGAALSIGSTTFSSDCGRPKGRCAEAATAKGNVKAAPDCEVTA